MIKFSDFIVGILLLFSSPLLAQEAYYPGGPTEKNALTFTSGSSSIAGPASSEAGDWFDVAYYRLELDVGTTQPHLGGKTTIILKCLQPDSSSVTLDLGGTMRVDSVKEGGASRGFLQGEMSFRTFLGRQVAAGEVLTLEVFYQGIPSSSGFGSFEFGSHSGIPWVWSLSEPYGARDWFPCKDHPSDKADSADIIVRCDSSFSVGSNGKLISVTDNADGTRTHHWKEKYPISSYLLSVAITNYEKFSNWFRFAPDDSMEILNYVLPENFASASTALPMAVGMMEIFSNLFGPYPFLDEKYGHADFGKGGAMEHQTMTSTTTYAENTIAHELAHQWFGDMITCRTWQDLWLNEGFAQYATALYLEKKYGPSAYRLYMGNQLGDALNAAGSLFVEETTSVRNLFDHSRVYAKGASVLHMLRRVLGDSLFFKSLHRYANDPVLKYSVASTADFQNICEETSLTDLDYFFDEWVFGTGHPVYSAAWNDGQTGLHDIELVLKQHVGPDGPGPFSMPVEIKLYGEESDTVITVWNSALEQKYNIDPGFTVRRVEVDPDGWILKILKDEYPVKTRLHQNHPNPCRSYTKVSYEIPSMAPVNISVFNTLGQKVATLTDEIMQVGRHELAWNLPAHIPTGVYYLRFKSHGLTLTNKMIVLR